MNLLALWQTPEYEFCVIMAIGFGMASVLSVIIFGVVKLSTTGLQRFINKKVDKVLQKLKPKPKARKRRKRTYLVVIVGNA